MEEERIAAAILDALARRRPGRSICPSEAARALTEDWRPLMPAVRRAAARLAAEGLVRATRRGETVDPEAPGGPIRLRAAGDDAGEAVAKPG